MEEIFKKKQKQLVDFAATCMQKNDLPALENKINEFAVEERLEKIYTHTRVGDSLFFHSCTKSQYLPFLKNFLDYWHCDPNKVRTIDGYTALHHAITHDNMVAVETLLEHGAHCYGEGISYNALLHAGISGRRKITEYLIEKTNPSDIDVIHAYELLGCGCLPLRDILCGTVDVRVWRKAMELRWKDKANPILKALPETTKDAYLNLVEPQNMEEYLQFTRKIYNIYLISCLVIERILGIEHWGLLRQLQKCAFSIDGDGRDRHIRVGVLKYAMLLCSKPYHLTTNTPLAYSMYNISYHWGVNKTAMTTRDMVEIMDAVSEGYGLATNDKNITYKPTIQMRFRANFMIAFYNIIKHAISDKHFLGSEQNCILLDQVCKKMCQRNLIDPKGNNLLHYAIVDESGGEVIGGEYFLDPDVLPPSPHDGVVQLLIKSGITINHRNKKGKTPLFVFIDYVHRYCDKDSKYDFLPEVDLLIEHGAHTDVSSTDGTWLYKRIIEIFPDYKKARHVNLQCLAAIAVVDSKVEYEEIVSDQMLSFIKIHEDVFEM